MAGSPDPSSVKPAAADTPASGPSGGTSGRTVLGGGSSIELNASDRITSHRSTTQSVSVSLKGRAGLPANATAVYVELHPTSGLVSPGTAGCNAEWLVTANGARTGRNLGFRILIDSVHLWLPVDADQTIIVDTQSPGCNVSTGIAVLGWVAPTS